MPSPLPPDFIAHCAAQRADIGFVPLETLFAPQSQVNTEAQAIAQARKLARIFNTPYSTRRSLRLQAQAGNDQAANLDAWMDLQGLHHTPCHPIAYARAQTLEAELLADPQRFLSRADRPYPYASGDHHWAFDPVWINNLLERGRARLSDFTNTRANDTAILVGNGPSLQQTDLSLLAGHDVYVSNYAINHPILSQHARGVAVSNYFVADQAPEAFFELPQWRVLPVGLSHVLEDDPHTIWLNALGGPLFFSHTPQTHIAWHATVSYFWMQVLLAAGYRKILLIGIDNSYQQPKEMIEGTLIQQVENDPNHFDPAYFRGKVWQAADTNHMAQTYALAKAAFEQAGGEIVNCTVGGALELFRRAPLASEL
ncbi:hypothetical protein GGR95_003552 [Sulfitobacter undariae]|uniref:DUF115 domain-containing protein n=1 Tax=Sulfitobacter undariae TaxID=1563671 RepID=A0A7W6E6Y2_9RHOB|nr:hypothetical protein [Sulfitobacter undariae]MBB3995886.1 hypothetical protein [Sulfitobacter undariae]